MTRIPTPRRRRAAARVALALTALAAATLPGTLTTPAGAADAKVAKVLDPRRLAEQSKPAVFLIESDFTASLQVPEVSFNQDKLQADLVADPGFVPIALSGDEATITSYALNTLLKDPLRYFVPGAPRTKVVNITATGSGFAVTPDGYVVTNAHVVKPDDVEIKTQLIEKGLTALLEQDSKDIVNDLKGQATDDQLKRLIDANTQFAIKNAQISDVKVDVFTGEGKAIPGIVKSTQGTHADVVQVGKVFPDKDVAVLKISKTNLITLPLGDENTRQTGDRLFAIGYPGDATFRAGTDKGSETEATLTDGLISAKKTSEVGVPILQTSSPIAPGSSGGPALDETGKVLGLTTAGITGTQGFNFVMPASIVKELLQRANVTPSEGQTTILWDKALDEFDAKHYKRSLDTLKTIDAIAPGSPFIQTKVSDAQQRISAGENVDPSSSKLRLILAVAGGLVLLLLLVGGGFALSRRGKKDKGGDLPPIGGYPGQPQPGYPAQPGAVGPGAYGALPPTAPPSGPPAYTPPPPSAPPAYSPPPTAPGYPQPGAPQPGYAPPPSVPASAPPPSQPYVPPPSQPYVPPPSQPVPPSEPPPFQPPPYQPPPSGQ